jgi:hypothetical protein
MTTVPVKVTVHLDPEQIISILRQFTAEERDVIRCVLGMDESLWQQPLEDIVAAVRAKGDKE